MWLPTTTDLASLQRKQRETLHKSMAAETSWASLFERLKVVEGPWIPPSAWESIPSQNASSSSAAGPPPSLPSSSTSSVSEASLVRLALNALLGLESALRSIEKLAAAFCSDAADRTFHQIPNLWNRSSSTHALGKILSSIGSFGSLVFLLHKFVGYFTEITLEVHSTNQNHSDSAVQKKEQLPFTLVNQAFAVAVGKVLEGYVCALDTIYASVGLRDSSKIVDVSCDIACLTSVVHSEVTLLELCLHTKELQTQIEALGNICHLHSIPLGFSECSFDELTAKETLNFYSFYRGGDLLSYLYHQIQVADPAHSGLLKFLFLHSSEPYCGFIRSWIFNAEISDPHKEFVLEYADNLLPQSQVGISIDFPMANIKDGVALPCFLKKFLVPILRAGQQLQVLRKLLELCYYVGPSGCTYEDFLPSWSGYLSERLICACPMTFKKGHLEDLVIARGSYYAMMLEKLGNLPKKLEFRYQQVVPHGTAPNFFDNGGESLENKAPVTLDGSRTVDNMDHLSSSEDKFNVLDASESSECSSLSGSEDCNESDQLIKYSNGLVGQEQAYLSSLKFFSGNMIDNTLQKPIQCERSHGTEKSLLESFETKKSTSSNMLVPLGLTESIRSCMSGSGSQCRDAVLDIHRPDGCLAKPFDDAGGYSYYQTWRNGNCSPEVGKANSVILSEGLAHFREVTSAKTLVTEGALPENYLENGTNGSNLCTLQPWKVDYQCNFLSANPMLRKRSCFNMLSGSGEKHSRLCGKSLPCFDFSIVEMPCKVSLERSAAQQPWEVSEEKVGLHVTAAAINAKSHNPKTGKRGDQGDDVLIDNGSISSAHTPLDQKEYSQEAAVPTNVSGGSSWETLLHRSGQTKNESTGDHRDSLLAMFEIPLDYIIDKCLLQEIMLQYKYVSKLAIKLLEEGFSLQEHLLALRRYHFMESADWADSFIMSLWHHKWCVTEADQRVSEIQGFLEMSVQKSSCGQDPNKDRLFVYIKGNGMMPLSTSAIGVHSFDYLGLGYRVDWPVSIVLTPSALKIYTTIFSFLIQLKLAVFSLTDIWRLLKDAMHLIQQSRHSPMHERELSYFNMLINIRHQLNHFISTLQQYVQSQLSHVSWCRFLHSLKYKVKDMMDLESEHLAYLTDSLHICFLSEETRTIASSIESILQCSLDFRSCLPNSMWSVTHDQGDLFGELSRISIAQVLTVKQKFDENLKELNLCYLKSPKHGEFGISCFWGYLNYNEYYSDAENQIAIYAFQV